MLKINIVSLGLNSIYLLNKHSSGALKINHFSSIFQNFSKFTLLLDSYIINIFSFFDYICLCLGLDTLDNNSMVKISDQGSKVVY